MPQTISNSEQVFSEKNYIFNYIINYIIIMARRKQEEHGIRTLQKTAGGRTYIVSLPIELVRELGWQSRQRLEVKKFGDGIMIKDYEEGK